MSTADTSSPAAKVRPKKDPRDTPAMRQHTRFKEQFPDCVLLFRMGDFYELFFDDAVEVAKAVGLTLTERSPGVPMAGVPHHSADGYIKKMLDAGFRLAIADQIQDPKDAKGVVDRAVTRVLTPGTLVDDSLLADDTTRLIAAASVFEGTAHLATIDASTGAFTLASFPEARLADELARRPIAEVLIPEDRDGEIAPALTNLPVETTARPGWMFRLKESHEALREQFGVTTLAGFGIADDASAVGPAGALVRHLRETQSPNGDSNALTHLAAPTVEQDGTRLHLDAISLRALEVEQTLRTVGKDHSLVGVLLATAGRRTAMGKRLVRQWLREPLADLSAIEARHSCVATLVSDARTSQALAGALENVQDVARIAGRLGAGRATPRDVAALGLSLARLPELSCAIENAPAFALILERLRALDETLSPIAADITARIEDRPPTHTREGNVFRDNIDDELDTARSLGRDASTWLAKYQAKIAAEHDLPGIKVGYNKVFGYYIELTAVQAQNAPDSFTRKQTLKNAERYITPELKEFEHSALTAESRAIAREQTLFTELLTELRTNARTIAAFGELAAELDALLCFAEVAQKRGWVQPEMVDAPVLDITAGRHPVLEHTLASELVPNDVALGTTDSPARLAILTGPNMAGKSTYIRQTALLTLLAHAGSFVPAQRAVIGLTDRICTRVGADDALHAGQSTFMVEMTETAAILTGATDRSLVILDEIGRGTGTLDGLALAWAIAERLTGDGDSPAPRTLFATHYHELTTLADSRPRSAANLCVAVREWNDEIVFLHHITPGTAGRSYGVHVARLAGVPAPVIVRAKELLDQLTVTHGGTPSTQPADPADQLPLFATAEHPVVNRLRELNLDAMTPLDAFDALRELFKRVNDA